MKFGTGIGLSTDLYGTDT